jgi:ferredoxin-NADP reductase
MPKSSVAICRRTMRRTNIFICGPDVMMDGIEQALGELGVPMSRYHSERYSFV